MQTRNVNTCNDIDPPVAHRGRAQLGMTLVEILVVLAIISLIIGGVSALAFNQLASARIDNAKNQTVQIQQLCEQFMIQKRGKCPKDLAELKAAGIAGKISKDPWGNDYVIKCPGEHGTVDVGSNGPDGKAGTEDDIANWQDDAGEGKDGEQQQGK